MFKINLEEELVSAKKASLSSDEQVVLAEAEKILNNSTEEDMRILKEMGLNYSVDNSKKLENKIKFIKSFDKTRVFSKEEIKDLCVTYGLRFLPIAKYKGEIDPLVPSKVKEFKSIHERVIGKGDWRSQFNYEKFMISAPAKSFELSEKPVDPLLFYPIDKEGNDYFLVHKWGNDISAWNAVKSWRNRNFFTWLTYVYVAYMLPLTGLFSAFTKIGFGGVLLISSIATVAFLIATLMFSDGDFFDNKFADENWDSEFK